MGLFDLFKKQEQKAESNYLIFDEFTIDVRNLKKEDFIEMGEEVNSDGEKFKLFEYGLPLKEWDIFSNLEFTEFEDGTRNIFFKIFSPNVNAEKLTEVINKLHKNLGEDLTGFSRFAPSELEDIKKFTWTGRIWHNSNPRISFTQEATDIKLGILGITKM